MEKFILDELKEYNCLQISILNGLVVNARLSYLFLVSLVKVKPLKARRETFESRYTASTYHFTTVNTYFKANSSKELEYIPYSYITKEVYSMDYSKYKVTPMSYGIVYGQYDCKFLLNFIKKISEVLMLPIEKSIESVETYTGHKVKPCLLQSSKNREDSLPTLCQVCYKYCCLIHYKLKNLKPDIQLSNPLKPINIYYKNWKGKYLYNENQGPKSMKWLQSYKCAAHTKATADCNHILLPKLLALNITNPCAISLILSTPCYPLTLTSLPKFLKLPKTWSTSALKLAPSNTSPNCTCIECNSSCTCLQGLIISDKKSFENRGYCEKYCACSYACPYKFLGCDCSGSCRSRGCVCYVNNIECNTFTCRACKSLQEVCTSMSLCGNLRVQRGLKKRTVVGDSSILGAGLGVFAGEDIKAQEFIDEYTGELISDREADRRGSIYDYRQHSFIFNLDTMKSIDASVYGNRMRYIIFRYVNHKFQRLSNCYTQIWRVNGTTKIIVIAKEDIPKGEELYFDYKYPTSVNYSWYQSLLSSS